MCFSATASFAISGALTAAGLGSIRQAQKGEKLLAYIPFFFAFQQFIEGLQWLVDKPSSISILLGYGFLFFAFLFWPSYIPWAVYKMEKKASRRKVLKYFAWIGYLVSIYLLMILLTQKLSVNTEPNHINYVINIFARGLGAAIYIFALCGSAILSSNRFIQLFGSTVFVTALFSLQYFNSVFISVWCFFAAAVSLSIFLYFNLRPKRQ